MASDIAVGFAIGLVIGFALGYAVRAAISFRRHQAARKRGTPAHAGDDYPELHAAMEKMINFAGNVAPQPLEKLNLAQPTYLKKATVGGADSSHTATHAAGAATAAIAIRQSHKATAATGRNPAAS